MQPTLPLRYAKSWHPQGMREMAKKVVNYSNTEIQQVRQNEWHVFQRFWYFWRAKNELEAKVKSTGDFRIRCPQHWRWGGRQSLYLQSCTSSLRKSQNNRLRGGGPQATSWWQSWSSRGHRKRFFPVACSSPSSLWEMQVTKYVC